MAIKAMSNIKVPGKSLLTKVMPNRRTTHDRLIDLIILALNFAHMGVGLVLIYLGVYNYYYYAQAIKSVEEHFATIEDVHLPIKFNPASSVVVVVMGVVALFTSFLGCFVADTTKECPKTAYLVLLVLPTVINFSLGVYGLSAAADAQHFYLGTSWLCSSNNIFQTGLLF